MGKLSLIINRIVSDWGLIPIQASREQWLADKKEKALQQKTKEDEEKSRLAEEERERKAKADEAYNRWYKDAVKKPKPVPSSFGVSQGMLKGTQEINQYATSQADLNLAVLRNSGMQGFPSAQACLSGWYARLCAADMRTILLYTKIFKIKPFIMLQNAH